jgi:hypothetical protein
MFKHLLTTTRRSTAAWCLATCLFSCLVLLALSSVRHQGKTSSGLAGNRFQHAQGEQVVNQDETKPVPRQLVGAAARKYLDEPGEGQSLMRAINAARFGLKRQERGPFGETGSGYLGMSHVQNLNAWFAEDGVTVRPTVSEDKREGAWHMELRLKAYGYGNDLVAAPAIVAQHVKDNRIEYERSNFELRNANFEFRKDSLFNLQSAIQTPKFIEWYENRAEGIEQGFTIATRPGRNVGVKSDEPLRLLVSLNGNLRAEVKDAGKAIELTDFSGRPALLYSKLTALDADSKQLAAHMEASADGSEIALVVDDRGASYPIVIDPIVANLEKILDANAGGKQVGAQFGDAVAIDRDQAVVGSWLEDSPLVVDAGTVYFFTRTGSTWSSPVGSAPGQFQPNAQCGYSVAISGGMAAFGCAGTNNNTGSAWVFNLTTNVTKELAFPVPAGSLYGASVAIYGGKVVVGAPSTAVDGKANVGAIYHFTVDENFNVTSHGFSNPNPTIQNARFGDSVAMEGDTILIGMSGRNQVIDYTHGTLLQANDSAAGDLFGQKVAVSGNTAVVGAPTNDEKGTDAGAAYVFIGDATGHWSQQQKLMASDGKANDIFSYSAVAIEGNTIVVGARRQDLTSSNANDNSGAAYVFTRNGTVWTQQTKLAAGGFFRAPGDEFGTSVGISDGTVIVSAPHEPATDGTANAGVAYVYRLDCVPPFEVFANSSSVRQLGVTTNTVCAGEEVDFFATASHPSGIPLHYQWRKNGVIIPGATDYRLVVQNANTSDVATYDAIVSTDCGSDITNPVTLALHTFSLTPTSQNVGASGSNGIVNVSSTANCGWTAVSNSPYITITSGASGTAPGTVGFTVAGNTGPNQRTGTITVGDKTFTITQDGLNCSYSISPTAPNFSASANASSVNVTATAGCAWTASSNDNWLTVTSGGSGTGNGVTNYSVAANTGPARTGTLTVAGQIVTVTQANGCTFALTPTAQNFPASIAAGAVNVTSAAGCTWTATSNTAFISVTSGANGSGNGTVGYSLTANDVTSLRSGTLTIAGQTFTVTQDGATLNAVQFSSANYNVQEDCTTVTISVNRLGDTSVPASVDYNTSDVTATERKDYITALGSLRFAAGETSKSFAVLINEDSFVEGSETFNISLTNPSGVTLGGPAIATVTITDDASESTANTIDDPQSYVCQHYHDFLNRQADASGLTFWTNEITSCGADQSCIQLKRVNVSAAYFLSIEFQQTGYLVERLYKTAYGNGTGASILGGTHQLPVPVMRFQEFLRDTQQIGQGVIVGQAGWEAALENNKQAFTTDFVQQSRFTAAFTNTMTAAQFVDALNSNAGSPLSAPERNQLVNDLSTGAKTRAQVLRAIAENPGLVSAESNRAFVLMQFFGYLRRNPNDSPDADYTGYDFWLAKLNQFNGDFVNAEMVKAFLSSAEYRQRFGQ